MYDHQCHLVILCFYFIAPMCAIDSIFFFCQDHKSHWLFQFQNYKPNATFPEKILKIIPDRIGSTIGKEIDQPQFGFRPGSGTREGIFCFNILAQKYSKAFDRVHITQFIECLEKIGIDGRNIRTIANIYWHQKADIRIQNEISPCTFIERGVRQGCVLSPYLLNIYTEFIFRESNELKGNIDGVNINNLRICRVHRPHNHGTKWPSGNSKQIKGRK